MSTYESLAADARQERMDDARMDEPQTYWPRTSRNPVCVALTTDDTGESFDLWVEFRRVGESFDTYEEAARVAAWLHTAFEDILPAVRGHWREGMRA